MLSLACWNLPKGYYCILVCDIIVFCSGPSDSHNRLLSLTIFCSLEVAFSFRMSILVWGISVFIVGNSCVGAFLATVE
jgi:hypothetical protein